MPRNIFFVLVAAACLVGLSMTYAIWQVPGVPIGLTERGVETSTTIPPLFALLLDHTLELLAPVALFMGRHLISRAAEWLKLRADSEVRAYLEAGLERAVAYGLAEARRRVVAGALPNNAVSNAAGELARGYAQERWPDALARFDVDTVALDKMIRARLPKPTPAGLAG
ncbi:hypothetical protein [Falsiroseomonas sp.]|uniref:hypothetical protein n=1 Tax=Falsiroseomonas sp. TaxID=2870721 RepID=UPI003F724F5C